MFDLVGEMFRFLTAKQALVLRTSCWEMLSAFMKTPSFDKRLRGNEEDYKVVAACPASRKFTFSMAPWSMTMTNSTRSSHVRSLNLFCVDCSSDTFECIATQHQHVRVLTIGNVDSPRTMLAISSLAYLSDLNLYGLDCKLLDSTFSLLAQQKNLRRLSVKMENGGVRLAQVFFSY